MFTSMWNLYKSVSQLVLTNSTSIPSEDAALQLVLTNSTSIPSEDAALQLVLTNSTSIPSEDAALQLVLTNSTSIPSEDDSMTDTSDDEASSSDESKPQRCLYNRQEKSKVAQIKILKEELKKTRSEVASLEKTCRDQNQCQEMSSVRRAVEYWIETRMSLFKILMTYHGQDRYGQLLEVIIEISISITKMKRILAMMDKHCPLKKSHIYTEFTDELDSLNDYQISLERWLYTNRQKRSEDVEIKFLKEELKKTHSRVASLEKTCGDVEMWRIQVQCDECSQLAEDSREIHVRITEMQSKFVMDTHSVLKKSRKCSEIERKAQLDCLK